MQSEQERLAILEYKDKLREAKLDEIDKKLDDLLALRNRGVGAFWLASILFGTTLLGIINFIIDWIRG